MRSCVRFCLLPDLARAYEAAGKPGAAVTVYERYLATPWFWRYETDAVELGWAMKRLAELYPQRALGILRDVISPCANVHC